MAVIKGRKEGNGLFNDELNTFLYGVRHMVKDQSNSERGTHTFVIPVVEHWLEPI